MKQVRQEKIKQNAYSRDDEEPKPWKVEVLSHSPTSDLKMANLPGASPFYPALDFQTRKDLKKGKATLISLLGYKNTVKYGDRLKLEILSKIKKLGINANEYWRYYILLVWFSLIFFYLFLGV